MVHLRYSMKTQHVRFIMSILPEPGLMPRNTAGVQYGVAGKMSFGQMINPPNLLPPAIYIANG